MRISKTLPAIALGLVLTLGACNGGGDAEEGDTNAASEEAAEHDADAYMVDESGRLEDEIGPNGFAPINERLAEHHTETGEDIHILIVEQLPNGEDIGTAAQAALESSDANAMIYISVRDELIAVGGDGVTSDEGSPIAVRMVEEFDNDEQFMSGFNNGITSLIEAMNN